MKTEETNKGTLENWTPQEVAEAFERDEIVLIDVRTPQEYSFERIDGALLAPMQAFQAVHMIADGDFIGLAKPDEKRQSRIVFIGRDLNRPVLRRGFEACAA